MPIVWPFMLAPETKVWLVQKLLKTNFINAAKQTFGKKTSIFGFLTIHCTDNNGSYSKWSPCALYKTHYSITQIRFKVSKVDAHIFPHEILSFVALIGTILYPQTVTTYSPTENS